MACYPYYFSRFRGLRRGYSAVDRGRSLDQHPMNALRPVHAFTRISLAFLLVISLAACQSLPKLGAGHGHPAGQECLHEIIDRGILRVGMTGAQPPLNMKNAEGELIGLDVELAQALADAMKVELELVERPFANLLPDLEAGSIDLVISSLTITPARNARVAFAGPYLISGSTLLTRADLVQRVEDFNAAARTWAALESSTGKAVILEKFPLAQFVVIDNQEDAVQLILDGEIDGLVADFPFVEYALVRNLGKGLATLEVPLTTEPLGVALPANSPLFANLVQNYLNTLDYTGRLMQMKVRWMNDGDWLEEMP